MGIGEIRAMGFILIDVPADIHTFLKLSKIVVDDVDKLFFRQGIRRMDGIFR